MTAFPTTVPVTLSDGNLLALPLADFARRFAIALPPLIRFLLDPELRQHPKWGRYLPFDVEPYGPNPSPGHAFRPDIVWTADGPRVTEIDFVPSGRGSTLSKLPEDDQLNYLRTFADWYASMGAETVFYATGSVTACRNDADAFARLMRQFTGHSVTSVNIDEVRPKPGSLIDRLFYRSELMAPFDPTGLAIATAEPWLDSKMVFALVHDPDMTTMLTAAIGADNLAFLREVLIPTYCLDDPLADPSSDLGRSLVAHQNNWLLKSSRVEEDYCWGCRSVVLGSSYSAAEWDAAIHGINPPDKTLGRYPLVQPFMQSKDFTKIWNTGRTGQLATHPRVRLNASLPPKVHAPAEQLVTGRLGIPFLVSRANGRVYTPSTGLLTLREDPLAHITPDAMVMPFRIV